MVQVDVDMDVLMAKLQVQIESKRRQNKDCGLEPEPELFGDDDADNMELDIARLLPCTTKSSAKTLAKLCEEREYEKVLKTTNSDDARLHMTAHRVASHNWINQKPRTLFN